MEHAVERARELVLKHGHNPTAYQTLNPGFAYYFSEVAEGVTAYVAKAGMWVAAGVPICAEEDLGKVAKEFEQAAAADGARVCYMCATERLRKMYRNSRGHSAITMGAEPVWDPRSWGDLAGKHRSIRAQINRARNKSVTAREWEAMGARTDVRLRRVLKEWLAGKNLPPMKFLNDSDPARGPLEDRLLFVASWEGEPVAYLLASPVPMRKGYLVEQLARSPRAPNGTAELLIDHAMRVMGERGCQMVTMGLVALTKYEPSMRENPLWVRPLFAWARAHGRRFYYFDGLEAFRAKLRPDHWEPVYMVANRGNFPPRALYAMAAALLGGSPVVIGGRAMAAAVKQEMVGAIWGKEAARQYGDGGPKIGA